MFEALVVIVLLVGALALWWLLRGKSTPPRPAAAQRPQAAPAAPQPGPRPPPRAAPVDTPPRAPLPAPPQLLSHEQLPAARRQALLDALRQIPRPPSALQQLVSPEFVARASSSELGELVMAEPVVAARVIAAVNAPLYGLRKPVTHVGQAITFLGLNTVRSLALQHLLRDAVPTQDPQLRAELERLARSSAIASELFLALAKRLQRRDTASLGTQLVLHFLGRFAAAAQAPAVAAAAPAPGLQARARDEQQRLGLSAGEIGALLMHEWQLPPSMVAHTRDISRIAFVPAPAPDADDAAGLALCALCASWGERIARRELADLSSYAPAQDPHDDLQALAPHLSESQWAAIGEALQDPALARVTA